MPPIVELQLRACPSHQGVLPASASLESVKVNAPALHLSRTRLHGVARRLVDTHRAVAKFAWCIHQRRIPHTQLQQQHALGAPLITSATRTSRVGWIAMSPDSLDSGVVAGASVATVRTRVGPEARPDRLITDADCVQDRSKDIGK